MDLCLTFRSTREMSSGPDSGGWSGMYRQRFSPQPTLTTTTIQPQHVLHCPQASTCSMFDDSTCHQRCVRGSVWTGPSSHYLKAGNCQRSSGGLSVHLTPLKYKKRPIHKVIAIATTIIILTLVLCTLTNTLQTSL